MSIDNPLPDSSSPIYCPYKPGELLSLALDENQSTCDFEFIRIFSPFSLAIVLTARPVSPPVDLQLPPLVILKILDARYVSNDRSQVRPDRRESGWSEQFSAFFLERLSAFRAENWVNHWAIAETEQQPVCARAHAAYRDGKEEDFALEMDHIQAMHRFYASEVDAYRSLQSLQGTDIPILSGTATYSPNSGTKDPILATVPCLILEYIDGNPLHDFFVPSISEPAPDPDDFSLIEISPDIADRASIAIIEVVRRFRELGVLHNDMAPRNILLRTNDRTKPVFIDFGMAQTGLWSECGVLAIRSMVSDELGWHISSPYASAFAPRAVPGHQLINYYVPRLEARARDAGFEWIPEEQRELAPEGAGPEWQAACWRVKAGIRLRDEDERWVPKSWQLRAMANGTQHDMASAADAPTRSDSALAAGTNNLDGEQDSLSGALGKMRIEDKA